MNETARVNVIGSQISVCDAAAALDLLDERRENRGGGYVCFTNVHAAVMCRRDPQFRRVTNESFLSLADGRPVYWLGRMKGAAALGHVPGPDLMLRALKKFPQRRHFFYGSTPAVLDKLVGALKRDIANLQVCGTLSPPFRTLSVQELQDIYRQINDTAPDYIWVGLGAPKQELWMAEAAQYLAPAVLFGVGAAFDFHAGSLPRAPAAMRYLGLEWLHRLFQEPKRLWRRYLISNTLFVFYSLQDALDVGKK
jgi:N-acetylglucosaminyldiphosphoundecaprenol N-acetyl-beta-D-mannosaminyltransferase